MADTGKPLLIKRYASRRLYNTETSDYVTLEDIAGFIRAGGGNAARPCWQGGKGWLEPGWRGGVGKVFRFSVKQRGQDERPDRCL